MLSQYSLRKSCYLISLLFLITTRCQSILKVSFVELGLVCTLLVRADIKTGVPTSSLFIIWSTLVVPEQCNHPSLFQARSVILWMDCCFDQFLQILFPNYIMFYWKKLHRRKPVIWFKLNQIQKWFYPANAFCGEQKLQGLLWSCL